MGKYLDKNINYIIYILIFIIIFTMIVKKKYIENFYIKKTKEKHKNNKIKYIVASDNRFKKKCKGSSTESYAQVTNNYPLDYRKYINKYRYNYIFKPNNTNNKIKIKNFENILNIDPKNCNRVNFWNSDTN